jgi:serine/threonine protein kinase
MNLGLYRGTFGSREPFVEYIKREVAGDTEIKHLKRIVALCGSNQDGQKGCRHVIALYDDIPMPNNSRAMVIVMQYLGGGSLFDARFKPSVQNKLWTYAEQVLSGLRFLHQNGIIHSDVKPDQAFF